MISYPLEIPTTEKEVLKNDFLPEGYEFVRWGSREKRSMFIRSICFLTIKEYRKALEKQEKNYIYERLKSEMIEFLSQSSSYTPKEISDKLRKLVKEKLTEFSFEIFIPENGSILGSYFTLPDQKNKGFPFFSGELKEDFNPEANIFTLNRFAQTSDYMSSRIVYRIEKNNLQQLSTMLENGNVQCDYVLQKAEEFKRLRKNVEDNSPLTMIDLINDKYNIEYSDGDFLSVCSILKMNICLLRAWSDNVSVENYYYPNEKYPTICIFVIREGYAGLNGQYTETYYLPGGILKDDKIKYYLDPDKDELIIYQLLKYDVTSNSRILESNYQSYLENKKKGDIQTQTTELQHISVPEYGRLKEIMSDSGNIDQIGDIIQQLDLA